MYYPKSQIQANLYTKGNELIVKSSGENYIGHYYKVSNGSYYSGETPESKPTVQLTLIQNIQELQSPNLINDVQNKVLGKAPNLNINPPIVDYVLDPDYAAISSIDYNKKSITPPINHKIRPTDNDYKLGQYKRYFVKKINNPIFKELPKTIYDRYLEKDKYVQFDLYIPFNLTWTLTGKDKKSVANINYNILELTEQRYEVLGLTKYFKNKLTEYYKEVGS